ncbi:unnamed protein product [Vitrella brassicaformis CCMP3155]|uniref:Flagella associated protein n=1 Tax=Vitrella brassicaformis (strain CCMP3155) TaxID=1169540 RepID=A0A0G4GIU4_VITBC|nr:unnamed protein product [Vitrella brassicaformis CCMP3155]|eukprot:CEM29762.1 unnamed protein product [Vitrella brassicaformis CCMP3155]
MTTLQVGVPGPPMPGMASGARPLQKDPYPFIVPAGKGHVHDGESTETCIHPEKYRQPPSTPPREKKYRKNMTQGANNLHWGLREGLPIDPFTSRFGQTSVQGVTAADVMKSQLKFGLKAFDDDRKEETLYASRRREPRGKSMFRGHVLPAKTDEAGFRFGVKQSPEGQDAVKRAIWPREKPLETDEIKERYKKTHSDYDPGEPVNRRYQWPEGVNPNTYAFGATEKYPELDGTRKSMVGCHDLQVAAGNKPDPGAYPKTKIVGKLTEDFRKVTNGEIGRSKTKGHGAPPVPPDFFYGLPSGEDEVKVKDLVKGFYPAHDQEADANVGRCTKPGRSNAWPDSKRIFGVPSVRKDIPAPHRRSVADRQNYGDEVGADELLKPQSFADIGIADLDFLQPMIKDELKDVLDKAGYESISQLDDLFLRACHLQKCQDVSYIGTSQPPPELSADEAEDRCSLECFLSVYSEMLAQQLEESHGLLLNINPMVMHA